MVLMRSTMGIAFIQQYLDDVPNAVIMAGTMPDKYLNGFFLTMKKYNEG